MSSVNTIQHNNEAIPQSNEPIIIRVRDQTKVGIRSKALLTEEEKRSTAFDTGEDCFFKIKKTTQISKIFNVYAQRKGVPTSSLHFLLNGKRIDEAQTVEELELNDQDHIDCHDSTKPYKNGSLAVIAGLQSEGGKKLNGGLAVILNDNKQKQEHQKKAVDKDKKDEEEEPPPERMQVLIFGMADGTLYDDNNENSRRKQIKISNLVPMTMEQMKECVSYRKFSKEKVGIFVNNGTLSGLAVHYHNTNNYPQSMLNFYSESYYQIWPDDVDMSLIHATVVGEFGITNRTEKKWEVLNKIAPFVPNDYKAIGQFRYDMVAGCVMANKDSAIAVKWALKLEQNNAQQLELALGALENVTQYCRRRSKEMYGDETNNPEAVSLQLAASKRVLLCPNDATLLIGAANAECLCGNPKQGAHYYRRAISLGQMKRSDTDLPHLSSPQLQRVGGPLEHCRIISSSNGEFSYIDERVNPRSTYTVSMSSSGEQCSLVPGPMLPQGLTLGRCPIPDTPENEDMFVDAVFEQK